MIRHLDPDRRRPAPPHPGFDPREIDVDMDICRWCGGLVPAAEAQRIKHEDWEQRIANRFAQLIERVAILEAAPAQPSGAAPERELRRAPDPNVPTPPQEDTQGRGGVEDANQGTDAAGLLPGSVTPAPAAFPPAAGAANRVGRGSGGTGDSTGSAPADTLDSSFWVRGVSQP